MIKKALFCALFGAQLTAHAVGLDILKKTHALAMPKLIANNNQKIEFTDFSGTWSGTCEATNSAGESASFEDTIQVKNDASHLHWNNDNPTDIDDVSSYSMSGEWGTQLTQQIYYWNKDHTVLIGRRAVLRKQIDGSLFDFLEREFISLNNNQLLYKLIAVGFHEDIQTVPEKLNCTYNKVE